MKQIDIYESQQMKWWSGKTHMICEQANVTDKKNDVIYDKYTSGNKLKEGYYPSGVCFFLKYTFINVY